MVNSTQPIIGTNLMIFLDPTGTNTALQPCAFSTDASLKTLVSEIDLSSKDSARWKEFMTGDFEWEMSTSTLMNLTGVTGTTLSTKELFIAYQAGLPCYAAFAIKDGSTPSWTVKTGGLKFTGQAIILSMDFAAPNKEKATAQIQLKGTGLLTVL